VGSAFDLWPRPDSSLRLDILCSRIHAGHLDLSLLGEVEIQKESWQNSGQVDPHTFQVSHNAANRLKANLNAKLLYRRYDKGFRRFMNFSVETKTCPSAEISKNGMRVLLSVHSV